ncbi:MAG: diphthine--ammonia ligase [Candidatus Aenigmarchaeota archaeon]|nr:diphthine--ammonia ligase [Candidatus Aenigmarchaeota archaeon]
MNIGVLYSGGKDSTLALMKAKQHHKITCLITVISENKESFMFHTPNIDITQLQAKAMSLPLVSVATKGEKEAELTDLKKAIVEAIKKHKIKGIITGAVKSTYQASRIQQICHELGLWCFNPLWLKNQVELLNEIVSKKINALIGGVFAEPLDKSYLGKKITKTMVEKLAAIASTHHINPAGEGGEIETTVLDAPIFNKKIKIVKHETAYEKNSGVFKILNAKLVNR